MISIGAQDLNYKLEEIDPFLRCWPLICLKVNTMEWNGEEITVHAIVDFASEDHKNNVTHKNVKC